MTTSLFLPGVPEGYLRERLALAGGNEIGSGKFAHPESSAALAANAFGWFVERASLLPPLPGAEAAGPVTRVEVEYCARFPWVGGMHPWLDAAAFTGTHIIGIESKRFEPFRDAKTPSFSRAYDQPVWGGRMERYCAVRDALRARSLVYNHLDAAQLVKHAYGLVTEGRRLELAPHLVYIFAEPEKRGAVQIQAVDRHRHRDELADFAERVAGDEVRFGAVSYRDWLQAASEQVRDDAGALVAAFQI